MYVPGARGRVASVRPQVTLVDVDAGVAEPEGRILIACETKLALTVVPRGENTFDRYMYRVIIQLVHKVVLTSK